jgi:hypothetical protein
MKGNHNTDKAFSQSKICAINDSSKVNKLSSDATVCCSKCGATAHDPASLCSPVPISGGG